MSHISNKLFRLYSFLKGNHFYEDANRVGSLFSFSGAEGTFTDGADTTWSYGPKDSSSESSPESTMAVRPQQAWPDEINEFGERKGIVGPSTYNHHGLVEIGAYPISYIGGRSIRNMPGKEAKKKGLIRSVNGDIYEVMYNGKKSIAKILNPRDLEPEKWQRIADSDLEQDVKRHLPEIRGTLKMPQFQGMGESGIVIIMEKLGPLRGLRKFFEKGKDKSGRDTRDMLKEEGFVHKAISSSASNALLSVSDISEFNTLSGDQYDLVSKYLNALSSSINIIINNVVSDVLKENISFASGNWIYFPENGGLPTTIQALVGEYVRRNIATDPLEDFSVVGDIVDIIIDEFSDKFFNEMKRLFVPTARAVAKYHHSTPLVERKDPEEEPYIENKERYMYAEEYLPETKSLFSALHALKENNILWFDIHANNIMQRIENNSHGSPGDLVLIDVALYGTEEEISRYE